MKADDSIKRHPLKNFFIKKDMQMRLILKILLAVVIASVITTAVLALVYYIKSGSGYFYFMSNNLMDDLQRQSILKTILPSLLIAEAVSVVLGAAIGFFASRKYALPIFKIEQWLDRVISGEHDARMFFREKEEFEDITSKCNILSEHLVSTFSELRNQIVDVEKSVTDEDVKKKLSVILAKLPESKK